MEAEAAYRKALEVRPGYPEASYQLACNWALAGKYEEVLKELDHAIELGFSAYPSARFDDDMAAIAQSPRYQSMLTKIRDRYASSNVEAGTPVVFKPIKRPTGSGRYPLMLLLHGYGDSHESYFDEAEEWAKLGFVAVAVPGSLPSNPGAFIWSEDDLATTHEQLQAIISSPVVKEDIDPERVFVLGFSQGGMHAFYLERQTC